MPKGYRRSHTKTVLDAVRAHPGTIQRDLARRIGLGEGLVRGHLRQLVLERRIRVVTTEAGKKVYHAAPVEDARNVRTRG